MTSGSAPPPPAMLAANAGGPPPPLSSSKKVIWIVVSIVLGLILLVCLFVGAIVVAVFSSIKNSEPSKHAMAVATQDPRVQAALGSPVKSGWLTGGSINVAGSSGDADLNIPLQGTLHKGTLYVVAKKSEGEWTYQKLAVRVEDSDERIDLLRPPAGLGPRER
jgi:Cytochrome oxidase complex assembly protein 1